MLMRWSRTNVAAAALLAIHAGLLAWCGYRHSPTLDEVGHLPGGLVIWQYGRFDLYRVNPPLPRAVAAAPVSLLPHETDWSKFSDSPGARPEWAIGADLIRANGERSFWLFTLARWTCIPFSLIGGIVCWRWARALFGESSGLMALTLWCFCPNIIGNGSLVTPDVPAASLGALAAFSYWRWLRAPTWMSALAAGATLGLAELSKMTWVILFGLWPLIWIVVRLLQARTMSTGGASGTQATESSSLNAERSTPSDQPSTINHQPLVQLAAILLTGLYVLNLGYAFDGSFRRLDSYPFFSRVLAGGETRDRNSDPPSNRFAETWLGTLPVPLPYDYLTGMDLQKQDFEIAKTSYLRGEFRHGGWWYYYLYAAAIKLPIGVLLLIPLAAALALTRRARLRLVDALPLIVPPLVVFALVSSQTGFNRYFRYVLPALPFLFVWISRIGLLLTPAASTTLAASRSLLRTLLAVAIAAIVWAVGSSLYYWPHSLSYFNELAGGPRNGHAHLIDANIDWGQDLLYLREWIDAHPEARPLTVTYEGFFDPAVAGVDFPRTPALPPDDARPEVLDQLKPGWHAVSVSYLRHSSHMYDYLQPFEPTALAGYSIYIYRLSAADVEGIRWRHLAGEDKTGTQMNADLAD